MIGDLFFVQASGQPTTQAGALVANGILEGATRGQLTTGDQEQILFAAARTPGGSALNTKQLLAAAGLAALAGVTLGYVLGRKKR